MSDFSNDKPSKHSAEKPVGQTQEELGLAGESVDFNSVLSAVSGNGTHDASEKPVSGKHGPQKDLNLSSVIANIQDEGPAIPEGQTAPEKQEPQKNSEDIVQPNSHPPIESTTKPEGQPDSPQHQHAPQEESQQPVNPSASVDQAATTTAATGEARLAASPVPVPWSSILMRVLLTALLVGLAGISYLLYTQEAGMQMRDDKITQLNEDLKKMEGQVAFLDQQLQQQQKQISNLITSEQMQEQLNSQRQDTDAWLQSELRTWQSSRPTATAERTPNEQSKQSAVAKNAVSQASTAKPETASAKQPVSENRAQEAAGKGGKTGNWVVHVASYSSRNQAKKTLRQYAKQIPDAKIQAARVKGKEVFRVSVPGFSSKKEALAYHKKISKKLGLKGTWISKNKDKNILNKQ